MGLAFTTLAYMQDRSLKSKQRGPLWEWIPSLNVCRRLSYRTLAEEVGILQENVLMTEIGDVWEFDENGALAQPRLLQFGIQA